MLIENSHCYCSRLLWRRNPVGFLSGAALNLIQAQTGTPPGCAERTANKALLHEEEAIIFLIRGVPIEHPHRVRGDRSMRHLWTFVGICCLLVSSGCVFDFETEGLCYAGEDCGIDAQLVADVNYYADQSSEVPWIPPQDVGRNSDASGPDANQPDGITDAEDAQLMDDIEDTLDAPDATKPEDVTDTSEPDAEEVEDSFVDTDIYDPADIEKDIPDLPDTSEPDAGNEDTQEPDDSFVDADTYDPVDTIIPPEDVTDTSEPPDDVEDTTEPDVCEPSCPEGYCGSDGCGGICSCNDGLECILGLCMEICVPSCPEFYCGTDGCEGICECSEGLVCNAESLLCEEPPCEPSCPEFYCGGDGCEGVCECSEELVCNAESLLCEEPPCEPSCPEFYCGTDGCGAICTCIDGFACNVDTSTCLPVPTVFVMGEDHSDPIKNGNPNMNSNPYLMVINVDSSELEGVPLVLETVSITVETNIFIGGKMHQLKYGLGQISLAYSTPLGLGLYVLDFTEVTSSTLEWGPDLELVVRGHTFTGVGPLMEMTMTVDEVVITDGEGNPVPVVIESGEVLIE